MKRRSLFKFIGATIAAIVVPKTAHKVSIIRNGDAQAPFKFPEWYQHYLSAILDPKET